MRRLADTAAAVKGAAASGLHKSEEKLIKTQ